MEQDQRAMPPYQTNTIIPYNYNGKPSIGVPLQEKWFLENVVCDPDLWNSIQCHVDLVMNNCDKFH